MNKISQYLQLKEKDSLDNNAVLQILEISHEMRSGKLSFQEVFSETKQFFVSEIDENRLKAIRLIRFLLLRNLQMINHEEFKAIFNFFIDKIKDIILIEETIQIILILLDFSSIWQLKTPAFEDAMKQFLCLFSNNFIFFLPAYNQKVRLSVLKILEIYLDQKIEDFEQKKQFLSTFLNQIEGEKDPRNLLKILTLIKRILDTFEEKLINERKIEIFDLLDCYYPISFNKPKNLKVTIEGEDLEEALNSCLFHKVLYDKSWTFLLEKLNSGVLESQIAGLISIKYILSKMGDFIKEIDLLKIFEILRNFYIGIEEEDLIPEVITGIKGLLGFLSSGIQEKNLIPVINYLLIQEVFCFLFEEIKQNFQSKTADVGMEILVKLSGECGFIRRNVNKMFGELILEKSNEDMVFQNYFLFLRKSSNINDFEFSGLLKEIMIMGVLDVENEKKAVFCMKILGFAKLIQEEDLLRLWEFYGKWQGGTELFKKCFLEFIYENSSIESLWKILQNSDKDIIETLEKIITTCQMNKKAFWYEKFLSFLDKNHRKKPITSNIKRILAICEDVLDYKNNEICLLRRNFFKKEVSFLFESNRISCWFLRFLANFIENLEEIPQEIIEFMIEFSSKFLKGTPDKKSKKFWLCFLSNLIYYHNNETLMNFFNNFSLEIDPPLILITRIILCLNTQDLISKNSIYAPILSNKGFLEEIGYFSKKTYIKINPIFPQILFQMSYSLFQSLQDIQKKPLLTHLFLNTPFILLKSHFQEALDLIIDCFIQNPLSIDSLNASIDLLNQILENFGNSISTPQSEELIKNLVNLLEKIPKKPMETVKKVINSLGRCHNLSFGANAKYEAIIALKRFLDYPKRVVRQETASALNLWHSI